MFVILTSESDGQRSGKKGAAIWMISPPLFASDK